MPCRIEISDFEIQLKIGCQEVERAHPQPIRIRAQVRSLEKFPATQTDRLVDTVDAAQLYALLMESAQASSTYTLERLGEVLELAVRERFPNPGLEWEVALIKPRYGWTYIQTWST